MISRYFEAPWAVTRARASCVGPYVDTFATALAETGYSPHSIRDHIRTAAHVGRWADRQGIDIVSWDDDIIPRFRRHLSRCRCAKGSRGKVIARVTHLLTYLRAQHVIAGARPVAPPPTHAAISESFAAWTLRHRGVAPSTVKRYQRVLRSFLADLGEDPTTYSVARIRSFVIGQLGSLGRGKTRSAVSTIRAFLRFLVAERRVPSGLEHCVPSVPQWRLSSLPRYLEMPEVERVVQSCDLSSGHGLRDHAILLLLARLGLRGGDVVGMMLPDIDWERGTLRVRGKGRREVLLPLPHEVGEAVLAYLERGRPRSASERVFLTVYAPTRPFASSSAVSDIVRFALTRAGIRNPPSRGAHLLRHSAATAMLRAGASLDTIAAVLRHQSAETTAYYAKVDVATLEQVAQPWPGGVPC